MFRPMIANQQVKSNGEPQRMQMYLASCRKGAQKGLTNRSSQSRAALRGATQVSMQ